MRVSDVLGMCLKNLVKRKLRTLLTLLGVMIGTGSIILMISFKIGWQTLELHLPVCYDLFHHLSQTTSNTTLYILYCLHYSNAYSV
jgi:ABC-type antimicrobial peptide transport system permease subunit